MNSTVATFLYFAYGSNLLTERIHLNNPSAEKLSIGKVKNYRLDFNYFSQRWKGSAATIVEDEGNQVWGVLWRLKEEDKQSLDTQEGVPNGVYKAIEVDVEISETETVKARSYQLIKPLEDDRRPSKVYMKVIVKGAKENELPQSYIDFLEGIEHNGYEGDVDLKMNLKLN